MSAKSKKNKKENFPSRNVGNTNSSATANAWATNTPIVAADQKVNAEKKKQTQLKHFNDIRKKHIEAAKIHTENYESSSEEELENDSLLESVFKGYGGDKSQLQKTQEFLENVFQSGTATCLICIASVKRTDYVSLRRGTQQVRRWGYLALFFLIFFFHRFGHARNATVFSIWIVCNDGHETALRCSECIKRTMLLVTTTIRASILRSQRKPSNGAVQSVDRTICHLMWVRWYGIAFYRPNWRSAFISDSRKILLFLQERDQSTKSHLACATLMRKYVPQGFAMRSSVCSTLSSGSMPAMRPNGEYFLWMRSIATKNRSMHSKEMEMCE